MDRMVRFNVLASIRERPSRLPATCRRFILDKTGTTIAIGDRQASRFVPFPHLLRATLGASRIAGFAFQYDAGGSFGGVVCRTTRRAPGAVAGGRMRSRRFRGIPA